MPPRQTYVRKDVQLPDTELGAIALEGFDMGGGSLAVTSQGEPEEDDVCIRQCPCTAPLEGIGGLNPLVR